MAIYEPESLTTGVIVPFLLQLSFSAATISFSPSGSLVRHASLPVNLYFVHCIWSAAGIFLRRSWATAILCLSAGVFLHHLDIALLSRWTYEQNPYSPTVKSSGSNGYSNDHGKLPKEPLSLDILSRVQWGLNSLFQNRRLNTADEVKHVQQLPKFASSSRGGYLIYAFVKILVLYLLCDVLLPNPPPDADILADMFAPWKVSIFGRLAEGEIISRSELGTRAATVLYSWVVSYFIMDLLMVMVGFVTVALGISRPSAWRPFFGSVSDAYSVRRFWGRTWHQALRNSLGKPAEWVVEDVFGLKAIPAKQKLRKWLAKYAKVMLTFAISGVLHVSVDSAAGCGLFASGTMRYFLMQGFGIMLEDHVQDLFTTVTGLGGSSKPTWWERTLGYAWVAAFQLWTKPSWIYCNGLGAGSEPRPLLPVSLVGLLRELWQTWAPSG